MTDLPWTDMKVAFDIGDDERLWEDHTKFDWPHGWSLCETDGSGARFVAIFRVEFMPTERAGRRVLELLKPYQ